jgi:hypothetical protein
LEPDDLGKLATGPGKMKLWSHVKWAAGLNRRVCNAEDTTGFFLVEVFNSLPKLVRDLIRMKPRSTYEELAEAVQMLDMEQLIDAINKCKRDDKTAQLI